MQSSIETCRRYFTMANQDEYSDIPQEVPPEDDYLQDPENVARGHKATLANPSTYACLIVS